MKTDFEPSVYQRDIFRWIQEDRGHAVVQAVAGSGKTTTIVKALEHMRGGVLFCAFNKHIADELKAQAPSHVMASTIHSAGLRAITRAYGRARINDRKVRGLIKAVSHSISANNISLMRAVERLVRMTKLTLTSPNDLPAMMALIDHYEIDIPGEDVDNAIKVVAKVLVEDLKDTDEIDFTDMLWIPIVNKLRLQTYDWVCVDEAQDLSAAQRELILRMASPRTGRIVAVGDHRQCQPPGTLVMTAKIVNRWQMATSTFKAIETLKPGDSVVSYDRRSSALVRNEPINGIGKRYYDGDLIRISCAGRVSRCTPNHRWVTRWISRSAKVWITYLMRQGKRFRIGQAKLFSRNGTFGLANRARVEHADAAWILSVHDSFSEALIQETSLSIRHAIPQIIFHPAWNIEHFTQDVIDSIYDSIGDIEDRAVACLREHGRDLEFPIYSKKPQQRQGRTTIFETQACNLIAKHMALPAVPDGTKDVHNSIQWEPITQIARDPYKGVVFSLDVNKHHKYVSDGLVTCNSIYGFAGADTKSIPLMAARLKAQELPLSICYRCPASHVKLARKIVPQIEARPDAPEGIVATFGAAQAVALAEDGDMILCRTNAPLVGIALDLIRNGQKAIIRGRDIGSNLKDLVERVERRTLAETLVALEDYKEREMQKLYEKDKIAQAHSLEDRCDTVVALADQVTSTGRLISLIESIFSDESIGVVCSTIHKAKGLEADRVFIYRPDLLPFPFAKKDWELEQEMNLKYVALTRARHELYFVEKGEDF